MKKRILITGVNGFIGSALRRFIRDRNLNFDVFGIDLVKPAQADKQIFVCDLNNHRKLRRILSKIRPEYIFHLTGGRISGKKKLLQSNLSISQLLFETIKKIPNFRPRIIIPSTAAEYGNAGRRGKFITENANQRPISWYGFVKSMQTGLSLTYAEQGFDVVVGRIFNISGFGTPPTLVIGKFAYEISRMEKDPRKKVIYTKNLAVSRDFLDIQDVCGALLAIAKDGRSGEIYNICSARAYTIKDLLQKLLSYSGVRGVRIKEYKNGDGEVRDAIGSNVKIKGATRWRPQVTVEQSLLDTLNYYRVYKR